MKAFSIHLPSKLSSGSGPYIIWDDTGKWHLLRGNGEENSIKQKFIHGKFFFLWHGKSIFISRELTEWLKWPQQVGSKLGLNLKMKISFIYLNEMENKVYLFYMAGILVHQMFLYLSIGTCSVVSNSLWSHGL